MIITEKVSFEMVGLYKWLIEDSIDEKKFAEESLTEFINKAIENELRLRKIDLAPQKKNKVGRLVG